MFRKAKSYVWKGRASVYRWHLLLWPGLDKRSFLSSPQLWSLLVCIQPSHVAVLDTCHVNWDLCLVSVLQMWPILKMRLSPGGPTRQILPTKESTQKKLVAWSKKQRVQLTNCMAQETEISCSLHIYVGISTWQCWSEQALSAVACDCLCNFYRPEWPSPHDCTSSVWDELKFIPIIGFAAGIEVGSTFFFPHLLQGYP